MMQSDECLDDIGTIEGTVPSDFNLSRAYRELSFSSMVWLKLQPTSAALGCLTKMILSEASSRVICMGASNSKTGMPVKRTHGVGQYC